MSQLWHALKVGDKVKVGEWPQELREETLHEETRELYRWLIETNSILTVVKMDECGLPLGEIVRIVNGVETFETLLLNHGGLEIVQESV